VLFFNASTRLDRLNLNGAFSLLAGLGVRLAGAPVVHFACESGLRPCVLGTDRTAPGKLPPCGGCTALSRRLYPEIERVPFTYEPSPALETLLQGLSLADLPGFVYEDLPLGSLVLPSLRWILRRHHIEDDPAALHLFRQYILSAWSTAGAFNHLLDRSDPRAVVVFNGMFYPEATARFLAQGRGVPVISHEVGLQPDSAFFTHGEATAYPIDIPDSFELTPEQDSRLDAYLEKRLQGNFSMAGIRFWPEMHSLDEAFWQRARSFKQIVPVFTNVVFDTSQGHANVVFPDMFAWLDAVLSVMRAHPETFFVVRAHPDETRPGKESRESVAAWAQRSRLAGLPNVLFVDSREYFSSYELIQNSKFVIVYNSTIGLEASILGAPVLCGGRARFTQLPTVFFPQTADGFTRQAEEFLEADSIAVPTEFRRNARRFLYVQLFRTSLPFGHYLEEDGVWRGYVRLKTFPWQDLLAENNPSMRVIVDGILNHAPFLLEP